MDERLSDNLKARQRMVAWIRNDPKTYRLLTKHAQWVLNRWHSAKAKSGIGEVLLKDVLSRIENGTMAKSWSPGPPSDRQVGAAVLWIKNKVSDRAKDAVRAAERLRKRKKEPETVSLDYDMSRIPGKPFTLKDVFPCDGEGRLMPNPFRISPSARPGHYKALAGRIEDRLIRRIDRTRNVFLSITRGDHKAMSTLRLYENQLKRIIYGARGDRVWQKMDRHMVRNLRLIILHWLLIQEMTVAQVAAYFGEKDVKALDRAYRNAVPDSYRAGFQAWFELVMGPAPSKREKRAPK